MLTRKSTCHTSSSDVRATCRQSCTICLIVGAALIYVRLVSACLPQSSETILRDAAPQRQKEAPQWFCWLHKQRQSSNGQCSISTEFFEENGPNQPVILPNCGHTFSRQTVANLIDSSDGHGVKCPHCNKLQNIEDAADCVPNWDRIQSLSLHADEQGPSIIGPSAPSVASTRTVHVPQSAPLPALPAFPSMYSLQDVAALLSQLSVSSTSSSRTFSPQNIPAPVVEPQTREQVRGRIQLYVLDQSGRSRSVFVAPDDLVIAIKARLYDKVGVLPEDQRLIFAGKQLQDENTVSSYGLRNLNTIHLVARLQGGHL